MSLEETDYFAQLCANAVLVKLGQLQGLFTSMIRVFDDTFFWLRRPGLRGAAMSKNARVVWLDDARNAGLKIRVTERERRAWVPLFGHDHEEDEERPVSYLVEYEEVLVRTAYLVGVLEAEEERSAKDAVMLGRVWYLFLEVRMRGLTDVRKPLVAQDLLLPSYY